MNKIILAACLALTVLSGIVRGRLDQRWGISPEMSEAAERVHSIPSQLGEWTARELTGLSDETVNMLRCDGNVVGQYVHRTNGGHASMVFMTGPAGPLAQHTPEACYGSNNFSIHEKTKQIVVEDLAGQKHDFSVVTFKENNAGDRLLRVYFAWNRDGEWVAPASPRTSFAGVRHLYKIQVATNDISDNEIDAAQKFLRENLPMLKTVYQ